MRALISSSEPLPSTNVVSSLVAETRLHRPRSSIVILSSFRPASSLITIPPVRIAISSSICFRRSPNPGAFTARMFKVPRSLFTTKVASASPSTSSATITRFLVTCKILSKEGSNSLTAVIFLSVINT